MINFRPVSFITRIVSDEDMHQVLLDKAAKELEVVQRKYQDLVECRPVVEAIQTFVREVRSRTEISAAVTP